MTTPDTPPRVEAERKTDQWKSRWDDEDDGFELVSGPTVDEDLPEEVRAPKEAGR